MIETNNTPSLLQEYVLDLLPAVEKRRVTQQISEDAALKHQVEQERQIGQLVKQTLHHASHIDNGRLAQLMPTVPKQKRPFWGYVAPRQVAMLAMMFILLLGGWQWLRHDQTAIWPSAPTIVAVTATITNTPTATETQTIPTETAVANQTHPNAIMTPAPPPPTPVAAVPLNTN